MKANLALILLSLVIVGEAKAVSELAKKYVNPAKNYLAGYLNISALDEAVDNGDFEYNSSREDETQSVFGRYEKDGNVYYCDFSIDRDSALVKKMDCKKQ